MWGYSASDVICWHVRVSKITPQQFWAKTLYLWLYFKNIYLLVKTKVFRPHLWYIPCTIKMRCLHFNNLFMSHFKQWKNQILIKTQLAINPLTISSTASKKYLSASQNILANCTSNLIPNHILQLTTLKTSERVTTTTLMLSYGDSVQWLLAISGRSLHADVTPFKDACAVVTISTRSWLLL